MSILTKQKSTASITAAVRPLNIRNNDEAAAISAVTRTREQREAWKFYGSSSELNYPVNYLGRNVGRFRFPVGVVPANDLMAQPTVPDISERDELYALAEKCAFLIRSEDGDISDLAEAYTKNFAVAGEGWLVGRRERGEVLWTIFSVEEFGPRGNGDSWGNDDPTVAYARYATGNWNKPDDTYKFGLVRRVWQPSPKLREYADTTTFSVLSSLRTLEALERSLRARILSRLTQSGFLIMPTQFHLAGPVGAPTGDGQAIDDPFAAKLLDILQKQHDQGEAPAMPAVIRGDAQFADAVRFLTMDRTIDHVELELRSEHRGAIAKGMFLPPEVQEGMGSANHFCRTDDTKAFARGRGWVGRDDLAIGDEIMVLDHASGAGRWGQVEGLYEAPVKSEDVVEVTLSGPRGPSWTIRQTPEHRNPVIRDGERMIVRGSEIRVGDVLTTGTPTSGLPDTPSVSDDFVRLLAWHSADGTLTGTDEKPGQIRIGKSWKVNPDKVTRLHAALTGVFGPPKESMPAGIGPSWRLETQERGMSIAVLNKAARDLVLGYVPGKSKVISREFIDKLTPMQIQGFIDVWLDSDGGSRRASDNNAGVVWQENPERLDALEYAAVLSGRPVRRYTRVMCTNFKPEGVLMHGLTIGAQPHHTVRSVKLTSYSGTVWCPTTDAGTWLAQSEGGWSDYTGNSAWSVADSAYSHLLPYAKGFAYTFTATVLWPWLRDAAREAGLNPTEADIRRHVLLPDGSDVITRPNEAEDGRQLHDRSVISDRALRDRSGVGEGDAPSEEEYVRQLGRKNNNPYLATYGLDIHDEIDWDEVAAVGSAEGRPGVGSIDEAHRPADSSDPAGAPGETDADGDDLSARLLAAAAPGFVLAARKKVGAKLRARCEPDKELHAAIKQVPNESVLSHVDPQTDLGIEPVVVQGWFLNELAAIHTAVPEVDPSAVMRFAKALAIREAEGEMDMAELPSIASGATLPPAR